MGAWNESAFRLEVMGRGLEHREGIGVAQQGLKSMPSHDDKIEAPGQAQALAVA